MSDIATLDTEILKLQDELERFRDLQPQLDAVRSKAEKVTAKLNADSEAFKQQANAHLETVGTKYDRLAERNQKQFQYLSEAWTEQVAIAKEATEGVIATAKQVNQGAARLGELSQKLRAMADADEALPARLDKIDSTIAASLLVTQGLQARFDAMKSDLDRMADGVKKETKDQAGVARLEIQSSIGKSKEELATAIMESRHEMTQSIDQSAKALADHVAQVESKISATYQRVEEAEKQTIESVASKADAAAKIAAETNAVLNYRLDALKVDLAKISEVVQKEVADSETRTLQTIAEKAGAAAKLAAENNTALHLRLDKMMKRAIVIASVLLVFLLASLGVGIAILLHKPQ